MSLDTRKQVEKALQSDQYLSAGATVMAKLGQITRDPNATARDLGKVLQFDPALTSRVLKQVNSSFYGLSATIKTVTHAVVILGFDEIKHIALSVPVANLFSENKDKPGLDITALWDQTVAEACVARALSYHVRHEIPEQIFVAAMLVDAGMVVLNNLLGEEYARLVSSAPDDDFLPEVETASLGINHLEVGRELAEKWKFPLDLINTIAFHHDPFQNGQLLRDAALVQTARRSTKARNQGLSQAEVLAELPAELTASFQLSEASLGEAVDRGFQDVSEAKRMLSSD